MITEFYFAIREDLKDTGDLFLPKKGEPLSSGFDVFFAPYDRHPLVVRAGEYFKAPLGFRSFCPAGWYYELHPRSSSFIKKHLHINIGIIDESWEGESCVLGRYLPGPLDKQEISIQFGEAIAQIIPKKRDEINVIEISNNNFDELCGNRGSARGAGGFGSTDKSKEKDKKSEKTKPVACIDCGKPTDHKPGNYDLRCDECYKRFDYGMWVSAKTD